MGHEYDFGEGGKVSLTSRTTEHRDMFDALATLGVMGARIAQYMRLIASTQQKRGQTTAG